MRPITLGLLITIPFAACTSTPVAPTPAVAAARAVPSGADGSVTSSAVTTDRLRLRRAGGADIVTSLVDGQVIDVPINVSLDIWAEIRRQESDRVRLVVDWGNGNSDFTGCGACRLENTYAQEGQYRVVAKVIDLNAATGSPIMAISVTLRAFDPNAPGPAPTPIPCIAVSGGDFEALPLDALPVRIPGATLSSPGGRVSQSSYIPGGNYLETGAPLTITFDTDQASMTINWIHPSVAAIGFEAFDAGGNLVATGSQPFTGLVVVGWFGGTGVVSGVKFRKVILYDPVYYDNLSASCN